MTSSTASWDVKRTDISPARSRGGARRSTTSTIVPKRASAARTAASSTSSRTPKRQSRPRNEAGMGGMSRAWSTVVPTADAYVWFMGGRAFLNMASRSGERGTWYKEQ